jgi:hypothetical protein
MADYRVEFIPPGYFSEAVIYNPNSGLEDIKFSAQKVAINNDFMQEPDRIELEFELDDWLIDNFVNGTAVKNGVSQYDVKVFNGSELEFRGAVLLEGLKLTYPEETLKLKAYSYSYLIGLEEEYSHFPALSSLESVLEGLKSRIASNYDKTLGFIDEDVTFAVRAETDFPIYELFVPNIVNRETDLGFDSYHLPYHNDAFIVRFRRIDWGIHEKENRYYLDMHICTCEISNKICVGVDIEYNEIGDYTTLADAQGAIETARNDYPEHYDNRHWIGRREYSFLEIYGTTYKVASDDKTLTISSNNIYPTELVIKEDNRQYLNTLKCFLLIHNLTIVRRASDGLLRVVNSQWGDVHHGDITSDVVECEVYRDFKQMTPDFTCLDALYNKADLLKSLLLEKYAFVTDGVVKYKVKVDDLEKRNLALFDRMTINNEELFIVELKRVRSSDEYQLICWRV